MRVRFAYMTSIRGLTGDGRGGLIERLLPRLHDPIDPLGRAFELAAVVVDDTDSELAPVMRSSPPWPAGTVPRGLMLRMPSSWRRLTRGAGESLDDFRLRTHGAEQRHEAALASALLSRGVDVILSDRYIVPFGSTMLHAFGGRILRIAVALPRAAMSGVSVHVVTEAVDGGPVLASERWTFDPARITPEQISHETHARTARVVAQALERWVGAYRSYCSRGSTRPSGVEGESPMRRAPILT